MSHNDLSEDVLHVRLFNRFGRFLNQIKEVPLVEPINLFRMDTENESSSLFLYVLAITIPGMRKVCLWPFRNAHSSSALSCLNAVLEQLVVSFAAPPDREEGRFVETRRLIEKTREALHRESSNPTPGIPPPRAQYTVGQFGMNWSKQEEAPVQKHFQTELLPDDEGELHFSTPASVVDEIEEYVSTFVYSASGENAAFLKRYDNLSYALKILDWFRILNGSLGDIFRYERVIIECVANARSVDLFSPDIMYLILYEMNKD